LVGEGVGEHQFFRRDDLAIHEASPHRASWRLHDVVEENAGLKVELLNFDRHALRSPPLCERIAVRPCFPDKLSMDVERSRNNEFAFQRAHASPLLANTSFRRSRLWLQPALMPFRYCGASEVAVVTCTSSTISVPPSFSSKNTE